jgi:hypothetical protein
MHHDQVRRLHYMRQWRQGMLRDDRSLLRLHVRLHERRLHVLRLLQQHAALLRLLLVPTSESAPMTAQSEYGDIRSQIGVLEHNTVRLRIQGNPLVDADVFLGT